jgi:hypothetical protein
LLFFRRFLEKPTKIISVDKNVLFFCIARKSSYSPCSSIADEQKTKTLSNKKNIASCFDSCSDEKVTEPFQHTIMTGSGRQENSSRRKESESARENRGEKAMNESKAISVLVKD